MSQLLAHGSVFVCLSVHLSVHLSICVCVRVSVCVCVCRMVAAKDAETAGALMTFFLALGLSCGAALSFALRALV